MLSVTAIFKVGTSFLHDWPIKYFERLCFNFLMKTTTTNEIKQTNKLQALKYISFSFCSLGDLSLLFMNWTGNYSLQFPTQFCQCACVLPCRVGSSLFLMPNQSLASLLSSQEALFLVQYCQPVTKLKQLNVFAHVSYGNDFRLSSESIQNPVTTFWTSRYLIK